MDPNSPSSEGDYQPGADPDRHSLALEQRHFWREVIIVLSLFVLLIPALWVVFSSKSEKDLKLDRAEEKLEYDRVLGKAQKFISQDYLSVREEGNAMAELDRARDLSSTRSYIDAELERIGKRYLTLLNRSLTEQDWPLFAETLDAAQNIEDEVPFVGYDRQLSNLESKAHQLQAIEQRNHQDLLQANPTFYDAYNQFQDSLSDQQPGPTMIALPGGTFTMGSPFTEPGRDSDEGPMAQINIKPFAIGETEVTFSQYSMYAKATGTTIPDDAGWGRGERPVINISWMEARDYALWLSKETGFVYRLPTEAEWEYAARAGTQTPFAYGACMSSKQANFNTEDTDSYENCPPSPAGPGQTIETKTLEANAWGLYNIQGNVKEWVKDCWMANYNQDAEDGSALYMTEGGGCGIAGGKRVVRGGDWSSTLRTARTANRYALEERERGTKFGFRVVRELGSRKSTIN